MEADDFLKTPYSRQLIADADRIERDLEKFNTAWQGFWEQNLEDLGVILVSHLSVEHYLNEWLTAANPGTKAIGETRLSFSQKLSLAENAAGCFQMLTPGIRRLNRIRNNIAHDMNRRISDDDLQPIEDIVWPWHKAGGKSCRGGIPLIQDFALLASGHLAAETNLIRHYGEGVGLVGFQRWLREAMKMPNNEEGNNL